MGDRYDFELTSNLKEDVPDGIIRVIAFLMNCNKAQPNATPDDPYFGPGWEDGRFANWALDRDPGAGDAICSFRRVNRYALRGADHFQYTVHLRLATKIETIAEVCLPFAMWLAKWSDQNEYVGTYKGEHARHPTLLYFHDGELYLSEVSEPPRRATDGAHWYGQNDVR